MRHSLMRASLVLMTLVAQMPAHATMVDTDRIEEQRLREAAMPIPYEPKPHQDLRDMSSDYASTLCTRDAALSVARAAVLNDKRLIAERIRTLTERGECYPQTWTTFGTVLPPIPVGKARDDHQTILIAIEPSIEVTNVNGAVIEDETWYAICWYTPKEKRCF